MRSNHRSNCPISLALEALGDKWSLLVLRDLMMMGKKRYQEFLQSEEKIATNILADRLVKLEKQGIISKTDDPENGKQFIYAPTRKGLDLLPIMFELGKWGAKHDPYADLTMPHIKRIRDDEKGVMKEVLARFKNI